MPKAAAKTKHTEHKPELIELLLTEPINPNNGKGNPVKSSNPGKPVGFAEKFGLLLYETPKIGSTADSEFFIHGILGSVLTLPESGLVEKLGINKVYVKHTREDVKYVRGSEELAGKANVVKLCFSFEKDGKKQIALRVFVNDEITGDGNPGDKYRYSDDELQEIAKKFDISDIDNINVDEHVFRIRTEGELGNRSFRLHKGQTNGVKEKFKVAASSQSQINNEFEELDIAQSINLEDSFKKLSDEDIEKVIGGTEKIFDRFGKVYEKNQGKLLLSNSEAAYHGFHYGALALNFKYRYGLNCYVERAAGNGRADLMLISRTRDTNGKMNPKPIPVVVEFKGEGHTADEAIAQIKNKGYVYNLSIRTKAKHAVIVGIAKDGGLKVEQGRIFQSRGFIHQILEEIKEFDEDDISEIQHNLKGELKNLYHSIQSHERHYLSKLVLGQVLATNDGGLDKHIFTYANQDESIGRETTTFVLSDRGEGKAVILNIIEQSGEQRELRGQRKFDSNRILPIDELEIDSAVKIDITISTGVANKPDGFEAEGRKDKSYYQNIDIKEISSSSQGKFQGRFQKIGNVKIDNLVEGLKESSAIGRTSDEKLRESLSPLAEALFPFKGLIKKEVYFQAIMQGLFIDGEIDDGKEIRVYTESNASPRGRMDLALSFTKLLENDGSLIEDDPIIIELKLANSDNDASKKLRQAEEQMGGKYEILRSFTDKKTAKHSAIIFNNGAENADRLILASIRNVDVCHTTSDSSSKGRSTKKKSRSKSAPRERISSRKRKKVSVDSSSSGEEQALLEVELQVSCSSSKRRKTRSASVLCIDSRDEESIEEEEGKEELVKELFDTDEIKKRIENIELYDQLFKVSDEISKGVTINEDTRKALMEKIKDIDLDSINPEIKEIVKEIKEKISEEKKEIRTILTRPGVTEKVEKVAEGEGLYRTAFLTKENRFQEQINRITSNPEVMGHLNRIGKISGWTTQGMMYKNLLGDILSGDLEGVAINLGFIAGSPLLSKMAEAASVGGLKLVSEGKVFLGRTLGMASPFLARTASAFVVYDLVNQIKKLKAGDKDALVVVIGDSIYLSVDVVEIGIELAEVAEVLEGVSSVTGPIGAAIGVIVFVGTDIYLAIRTVEKEDKIIHLTGWERFKEGGRAFFHIPPEQYIEELIEEKEVNNQLVKSAIELLKNNTNIQRYVFPTGKSIVDSCRTIEQRRELCGEGGRINGTCTMGTGIYESYKREECDTKIQLNLESSVNFNGKIDIFPSRVSPDNPEEGELFCLQPNTANRCDSIIVFGESLSDCQLSNAYRCDSAIGVSYTKDRTGNYTLIALGKGGDEATGFQDSPNIFLVEEGGKRFFGGNKDDMFVLRGSKVTGVLHGGVGSNTIDLGGFALESESLLVDLFRIGDLNWENINNILGREGRKDVINCSSDIKYIDGRGGKDKNAQDIVYVGPNAYSHNDEVKIAIKPYTTIDNFYSQGKFTYIIHQGKGGASINLDRSPGKHSFLFNYTVQNIKAISFSGMTAEFTFLSSSNLNKISIFSKSAEVHYALRDGTEIRVDNKDNSYALQNTDKPIDEIIRDYPAIANRLNMTIAVQSHNESIIIGHGKHEVLYNDPKYNSHLIGNGGENIYVIAPAQKEINIYDVDEESSIDTVDLRDVVKGIRGVLSTKDNSLAVFQDEADLLIELELTELEAKILRDALVKVPVVRLKNGTQWYQKLHVILNNAPMQLERTDNHWKVTPIPLTFNDNTKIAAITAKDIEGRHRLIVDKQVGEYIFFRLRDGLMIVSDPNLGEGNAFIMLLSDFYQEPKMEILSIEFKDTIILLQEKTKEINEAVVFCPRILQINEKFSVNSSDMLSHYDCLKFNSDKILFSRLNSSLLLLSDKGTVLISDYVHGKWDLPIELNNSIIKPGEFRKRADNPSSFKYYKPDEEGLEIYHNQPTNKYQIGLVDLKNRSISDWNVEIIGEHLILSLGKRSIVEVKNWNIYQPAREMMFAFNDTVISNAKCVVSNCDPKDIVEEFKKEKAKLVEESTRRHRRHHIRHEHNHRGHRNHRLPIKEVTSGAARSSSWINVFANSIVDAVKGVSRFISSSFKPAIDMQPSKAMTTQSIDTNGTLLLLDVFIRKITGQKYVSTADQPMPLLEARGYALNITTEFERVLKDTAKRSGVSVNESSFNYFKTYQAVEGKMISGELSKIPTILYSAIEEAYPKNEKFLSILKGNIEKMLDGQQIVNNRNSSNQMQSITSTNNKMPLSSLNSIAIEPLNGKKGVTCVGRVA